MLASAAIAMFNAYLIQGFGLHDIVKVRLMASMSQ